MSDIGYVVYIDEAGDFGLRRVAPIDRNGASEWLVISGAVVRISNEPNVPGWLRTMRLNANNTQPSDLHFRTLNDRQKKVICGSIAELETRLFVVISNKRNMRRYRNDAASRISNTRQWFYWWLCRLLLERVTEFCAHRNDLDGTPGRKLRIEFSRRRDLKYSDFTDYLTRLWAQSKNQNLFLNKKTLDWSVMDLQEVHAYDHRSRAGLQIADSVASSFYQAANLDQRGLCRPQYAELLQPRIWTGLDGEQFDAGFKVFPYPLKVAALNDEQKHIFRVYGYPDNKW